MPDTTVPANQGLVMKTIVSAPEPHGGSEAVAATPVLSSRDQLKKSVNAVFAWQASRMSELEHLAIGFDLSRSKRPLALQALHIRLIEVASDIQDLGTSDNIIAAAGNLLFYLRLHQTNDLEPETIDRYVETLRSLSFLKSTPTARQ